MVGPRLILILGDQLTRGISALRAADKARDVVVMAEVMDEGTYVEHHPQKIALVLTAMRKFANGLVEEGWRVAYSQLDDPETGPSIGAELLRRAAEFGAKGCIATRPGEWRLIALLEALPLPVQQLPDDRFICSEVEFAAWASGRKHLRMEYFYRDMRRKTGLMMNLETPAGGQWNFDHDNRKPAKADMFKAPPLRFDPDVVTERVLAMVDARFSKHFGNLRPFGWATDRAGALQVLDHFIINALPTFGDFQDAMLTGDPVLSHSLISPYLNIGLLTPIEVCQSIENAWKNGTVPINSAEGFIRQIIGWREFVRGIYNLYGPGYSAQNTLQHTRDLPAVYWGASTRMACMAHSVRQTRDMAYAHHIQRLMITGNFALLAGIDPAQVHGWYLAVYADAFEWVEAPNTIGMSQYADGGVLGSKPYVSSGAYIDRMSDYCKNCGYSVKEKQGPNACPFNLLYWHFLTRHRARFENNPRMAQMYRVWDKMADGHKSQVISEANAVLSALDHGEQI